MNPIRQIDILGCASRTVMTSVIALLESSRWRGNAGSSGSGSETSGISESDLGESSESELSETETEGRAGLR